MHKWADKCGQGPECQAKNHDPGSLVSVPQVAKYWSKYHVANNKGCLQKAHGFVRFDIEMLVVLDVFHHSSDCGAIHVVDEINKAQYQHNHSIFLIQILKPTKKKGILEEVLLDDKTSYITYQDDIEQNHMIAEDSSEGCESEDSRDSLTAWAGLAMSICPDIVLFLVGK